MDTLNAQATVSIDGSEPYACEVLIKQEIISVRSEHATKPDPAWEYRDDRGHFHAFTVGGKLPTLRTEQVPCDGACGDPEHTVTRYSCLICGQEIEPHWTPDYAARNASIPGLKSATVEVFSDHPIGQNGDEVSIQVYVEDKQMIGVGTLRLSSRSFYGERSEIETHVYARFLEPRMSA